jgi:hypothetical protein
MSSVALLSCNEEDDSEPSQRRRMATVRIIGDADGRATAATVTAALALVIFMRMHASKADGAGTASWSAVVTPLLVAAAALMVAAAQAPRLLSNKSLQPTRRQLFSCSDSDARLAWPSRLSRSPPSPPPALPRRSVTRRAATASTHGAPRLAPRCSPLPRACAPRRRRVGRLWSSRSPPSSRSGCFWR